MEKESNSMKFWQILILVACCTVSYLVIYYSTLVLIVENESSSIFHVLQVIALTLNFIPYILYVARKTKINLSDYLSLPNLKTLVKIVVISALVRFVLVIPFDYPGKFFSLLIDSNLRVYTLSTDTRIPGIAVALKWAFIPLVEEVLFRGLILTILLKQFSPHKAILFNALIFSLYHVDLSTFFGLFIMGLILCIIFYKTNSILISTLSHYILYNGLLKFENLEFDKWDFLVYSMLYILSILLVVYLIRKPMGTLKVRAVQTSEFK